MVFVHQLMTHDPFTLLESVTLAEAVEELVERDIHGAVVVSHEGQLVGVVSLADLARATIDRGGGDRMRPVRVVMSSPAETITPGATLYEAARQMTSRAIHRLVVVDEHQHPIGLLTPMDVLRAAVNLEDAFRIGAHAERREDR